MVRTLDAQTRAIWPQEVKFFDRYALPDAPHILDAGCGTGEATWRLAERFPQARVLGVDVLDASLDRARARCRHLGARVAFENRSVYGLGLPDHRFDLTVCRHVIHSIPHAGQVLAELVRVTRPGGYLHLISEDYGMVHFEQGGLDLREFWHVTPAAFGAAMGTDLYAGRHSFGHLTRLGLEQITIDYVIVDTVRVPREVFAAMFEAWRDGYVEPIGQHTPCSSEAARACFDQMIAHVRDPQRYAVWMVPVVSARVPAVGKSPPPHSPSSSTHNAHGHPHHPQRKA